MATVLSLASVGIGDMELFMPSPPCLVVNTFYVDGEPESSVSYVWQDPETGELRSELAYMQPAKRKATPKKAATRKAPARKPTRKPPAKRRAARKAKR